MRRLAFLAALAIGSIVCAQADFTVHLDQPLCESFVGFGAQLNGWVFAPPNTGDGGTNEETAKVLEKKIIDLAPQHVRIFVEPNPGFRQDEPEVKASMIRTFQMAQRAGATINATHWHGPHPNPGESAQNMVNMLVDFIRNHDLHAIKYVTLQNEPNTTTMPMWRYNELYREFDTRLRKEGLRDQIKIIGGDLLRDNQEAWWKNIADNLANVCDGYSVHMYCEYTDEKHVVERVAEIPPIIASLRPEARKPLYVMEFGFRGTRTGKEEPGRHADGRVISDVPIYGLLCGWRMMESLNRGYVALVHWDGYDAWYDREPMQYGLLGPAKDGWRERPAYHLFRMFTHTAGPGWQSVKIDGSRDEALVSAMKKDSQLSIYLMNRGENAQTISVAGLPKSLSLHRFVWNGDGKGTLQLVDDVSTDDSGGLKIELPPQSVAALSTMSISR